MGRLAAFALRGSLAPRSILKSLVDATRACVGRALGSHRNEILAKRDSEGLHVDQDLSCHAFGIIS